MTHRAGPFMGDASRQVRPRVHPPPEPAPLEVVISVQKTVLQHVYSWASRHGETQWTCQQCGAVWRLFPTAHTDEYDLQGVQEIAFHEGSQTREGNPGYCDPGNMGCGVTWVVNRVARDGIVP